MSNHQQKAPAKSCHSNFGWMGWPKKECCDCMWRATVSPYATDKYGNDKLTELALNLAHWKNENVFPVDLKLRAPAVLFSAMLFVKS